MTNHIEEMRKEVIERARQDKIRFIQLQFTDIHGQIKSVTIPAEQLEDALSQGVWFDGSSIEGFTRICESDMYLKLDPATYALLPWGDELVQTARLVCDIYTPEGKPFAGDPRQVLKKVLAEAEDMGFIFNVGPELEFFLFQKNGSGEILTKTNDTAGYFDFAPRDSADLMRKKIVYALQFLGLDVEMSHHEVAQGQHEIDFKYGDALTQADRCNTFKYVVKCTAQNNDLYASFMPKPIFGANGSGMHVHQSLFDINTKRNLFYDENDSYHLSDLAKKFIAGQLAHAAGFCAITAPTVNSYKRLIPGYEAPVYICWANRNRSALIRIPRYTVGRENSVRCELRCPDPSCNPYLAFAVMLAAGLDGIKRDLPLPEPTEYDVFNLTDDERSKLGIETLPSSLHEALKAMENDTVITETLGSHVSSVYLRGKENEWNDYHQQVTPWETEKYLNQL